MIFRRLLVGLASLLLLCALIVPAQAQKTKAQLNAEITANYPDNSVGAITPSILRTVTADIVNSILPTAPVVSGNLACFNGTTGLLQDCGVSPPTVALVVGTTPVASGTTTRILFDNAGFLGEYAISGTGSVCMTTSCVMTTPSLGVATATTINKVTLTPPATGSTLTVADGKTATVSNSVTIAGVDGKTLTVNNSVAVTGTDGTVMTFPGTSATIARTDAGNAFIGNQSATGSILSSSAAGGVGYTTGAGAAITQLTNRATGVTINTPTGAITLFNAAGSATPASFTVTDSAVAATDVIHFSQKSGTNLYNVFTSNIANGSFVLVFFTTGGTATDSPVINFAVIKGSAS